MEEENKNADPKTAPDGATVMGKFKSVDALAHAYGELEAEFTRRSQRLKALEEQLAQMRSGEGAHAAPAQEELLRTPAPGEDEGVHTESGYLRPLKGAPLMGEGGTGVIAPRLSPKTIDEAGDLAFGYFKTSK